MKTAAKIFLPMSALFIQAAHAELVTIELTGHAIQTPFDIVSDGFGVDPYGANILGQAYDAKFTFDTADGVIEDAATFGRTFNRYSQGMGSGQITATVSIGGHEYVQAYESSIEYDRYASSVSVEFISYQNPNGTGPQDLNLFGSITLGNLQTIDMGLLAPLSLSSTDIASSGGYLIWNGTQDLSQQVSLSVESINIQAVPVPAATWLFGSGLIGLLGITRRK